MYEQHELLVICVLEVDGEPDQQMGSCAKNAKYIMKADLIRILFTQAYLSIVKELLQS